MAFDAETTTKSRDLLVLEKARDRIARGWCQNVGIDRHGSVCTGGGVTRALLAMGLSCAEYDALLRSALDNLGFAGATDHIEWNDAPGRTQAEVLARFDAAIAKVSA